MPYMFTFGDIIDICRALGMRNTGKGPIWKGLGRDGVFRRLCLHSHGPGRPVATGTVRAFARQLGFQTLKDMYLFLKSL